MSDFMQWVTHGVKRGRFEMDSRAVLYLSTLAVTLILVTALYLTLVSRTAAQGRHIEQLQAELFQLQRENEHLEVEIAEESAVSRLMKRAVELGLAPAEQIEYLITAE